MKKILLRRSLTEFFTLLFSLLIISIAFNVSAEDKTGEVKEDLKLSKLFQSYEPIKIRLEAPFKKVSKKRKEDRPYSPAVISYSDASGQEIRIDLKLRVRGKYRAKKEICRFPPLKLNFQKKSLAGTIFDGEDKLKLVTHCQGSAKYEQFVLLEYLNYRMQALFNDYSLRARLAIVKYVDSDKGKLIATKWGFFIEDKDKMAARLGGERVEIRRVEKVEYEQGPLHVATAFEYLIGNTDFSVILGPEGSNCCHNIIPIKLANGSVIPVPYDFDASGIINPPYLSPPEHLGLRSTRQRLYRGYCQNTAGFKKTFEAFHAQREAVFALYNNQQGLADRTRNSTIGYIEKFYNTISGDDKIVSEFIDKCRS
jgi:hypothetical protein